MSNMSYCRFQNTVKDLRDCQDALDDIGDNLAELSKDEAKAATSLIAICQEIASRFDTEEAAKRKETQRRADCFDDFVLACRSVVNAFDALPQSDPARYSGLLINELRAALKKAQGEV